MQGDLFSQILDSLKNFYHSPFFSVLKFLLAIYIAVLLVDIILIVILRGFGYDVRMALKGMDMPAVSQSKMKKKWEKIKARLEAENISQYKAAVLEADMLANKIFSDMRIPGKNLSERLENMKPNQIPNYEELKNAHQVRNKIIHEKKFLIEKEKAEEVLRVYEKLLRDLELI